MMTAFLNQSDIDDKKADLNEAARNRIHEINTEKALLQLYSPDKSLLKAVNGPSKVNARDIEQPTVSHERFKGYDHSLEVVREWNKRKD